MRYLLIFLLFISGTAIAQPVVQRSNGANTLNDPNIMHTKSLIIPVYADTSAANAVGTGLDSVGKIIFSKVDTAVYVRGGNTGAHIWRKLAGGTGGGGGISFVVTDSTLTGHGTGSDSLRVNFAKVQKKIIFTGDFIYSGDSLYINWGNATALGITGSVQYKGSDGKQKGDSQFIWDSTGKVLNVATSGTVNGSVIAGNNATGTFKAGGDGYFQGNNITIEAIGTGNLIKLRNNGADKIAINENGAISTNGLGNYGTSGQVLTSQGSGSPAIWTSKDTVAHNLTLTGQGNTGSPLGVDTINYIATKKNLRDSTAAIRTLVGNKLTQGGDAFGAAYVYGSTDNNPVTAVVNGVERTRVAITTGAFLVNQTTDNGTDKLQVNGGALFAVTKTAASGIGTGSYTHGQLRRTESAQTWGVDINTSGNGTSQRNLTVTPVNLSDGFSVGTTVTFAADARIAGNLSMSSAASEIQKPSNSPMIFRQLGGIGGLWGRAGFDYISNQTATGRVSPTVYPTYRLDQDGRVKMITLAGVGNFDSTFNYGAALDVKSNFGAFLPPRLTTAQRDSINGVHDIVVTGIGSGYSTAPTVTISGGGGSGATAVANVSSGFVLGITMTATGSGYTSAPTVSFGGPGTGATAVAHNGTLDGGMMIYNTTTGKHQGYNGSSWYDFAPSDAHYTISTTNATPTTIATISVPTGKTVECEFTVTGKDGSNNQVMMRKMFRAINVAGTVTMLGTLQGTWADYAAAPLSTATVTASASGANMVVQVTGVAATNISWDLLQTPLRIFY